MGPWLRVKDHSELFFFFQTLVGLELWECSLAEDVPRHWEKHEDLVLFPDTCFQKENWYVKTFQNGRLDQWFCLYLGMMM